MHYSLYACCYYPQAYVKHFHFSSSPLFKQFHFVPVATTRRHICLYTCIDVYVMYVYICVCVYMCIYVYICAYRYYPQAYVKQFKQLEQEAARFLAVFPCELKVCV